MSSIFSYPHILHVDEAFGLIDKRSGDHYVIQSSLFSKLNKFYIAARYESSSKKVLINRLSRK